MGTIKVKDYISYFEKIQYTELFDEEVHRRLKNIEAVYGDLETEETIQEILLSREEKSCDYSIKVLTGKESVKDYWYELDYAAYESTDIGSCYFIDASLLKPGADCSPFYEEILPKFAGEMRSKKLLPMLEKCVALLDGRSEYVFQLGAMTGRGQDSSLRFFTSNMKKEGLLSYLKDLSWSGNTEKLESLLTELESYSQNKNFILDFDIFETGISEKIGICFGTKNSFYKTIDKTLSDFVEKGFCLPSKKEGVMKWVKRYPSHTPQIQNDISHFKFAYQGENLLVVKAYLRQGSKFYNGEFRAYDTPVLMNLELTTRCPLRCPQCYCDLTCGKDLDLEKALYWIEEGAKNHVQTVNLSGGETVCYPHLTALIKRCADLGMCANIALSGYGVTKEKLNEWIQAGVGGIFVSLNGSTKELNEKTRDGYDLAIHALELLRESGFENSHINWVMHGCNADDFPEMLKLAETYGIKELAVMVFKPDASHQLPNLPTREQMLAVAKQIKSYQGSVKICVEPCFSQMKALIGERFLINLNQGIARGCGAGRDGVSINVDGKITPCRHLEFPEETLSMEEYWENSKIIKQLRNVEDTMEDPCKECKYRRNCLPCAAVNVKLHHKISMGNQECVMAEA